MTYPRFWSSAPGIWCLSQLIMPMEGVIFPHAGQYTFRVKVKGQTLEGPGVYLMEVPEGQATA